MQTTTPAKQAPAASAGWLELVAEQVEKLRFGVVQITVHEARVVQIERTEKVRLNAPHAAASDQA